MSGEHVLYRESTPWPTWVVLLLSVSLLVPGFLLAREAVVEGRAEGILAAILLVLVAVVFWLLLGKLDVLVTEEGLRLRFGHLPVIQKRVSFDQITEMDVVRYSPLVEFGGWGIRFGRDGKRAWTIRGNRALRLTLSDGKRLYVGSERPERLLDRTRTAQQTRHRSGQEGR
jgi:hypothetical protein